MGAEEWFRLKFVTGCNSNQLGQLWKKTYLAGHLLLHATRHKKDSDNDLTYIFPIISTMQIILGLMQLFDTTEEIICCIWNK